MPHVERPKRVNPTFLNPCMLSPEAELTLSVFGDETIRPGGDVPCWAVLEIEHEFRGTIVKVEFSKGSDTLDGAEDRLADSWNTANPGPNYPGTIPRN